MRFSLKHRSGFLNGILLAPMILLGESLRSRSVKDAILMEVKPHLDNLRSTRRSLQNAVDSAQARFWVLATTLLIINGHKHGKFTHSLG